ncbi:MAG: nucleotidyltransferase domain-containing protein, partial [Actinomycetota bacterium]|nr:nucleotidyltransferase domain-containing protein [Actinomycetota bacterium]
MGTLDTASASYAQAVRAALLGELGDDLVGVCLYGSAATGAYVHGQSDVDMLVVVRDHLAPERIRSLLDALHATPRPTAVRGLDVWVVPLRSAREPCAEPAFDCWLLTSIDRELIAGKGRPG